MPSACTEVWKYMTKSLINFLRVVEELIPSLRLSFPARCWKDPKTNTISWKWVSRNAVRIFCLFFHHLSSNILYFSTSQQFAFSSFFHIKNKWKKNKKKPSFIYLTSVFHPWCLQNPIIALWFDCSLGEFPSGNLCYFFMCRKLL